MANLTQVKGVGTVMTRLQAASIQIQTQLGTGLKKAGLYLQRASQKIVPVDFGHLRGSADTRPTGIPIITEVEVLYTASYAIQVHENLTARHNPGQFAKFLETPAREEQPELIRIIEDEVKP